MTSPPNLNALYASLVVEELIRANVTRFFIAPGARSAPLVTSIAASGTEATLVIDERAAGYAAVGYARATSRPAVVVTTSGTAVANLLPAVVESSLDRLPLILLTADRPPELRDAGANQTIDQAGIFGTFVRWEHELACPTDALPARTVLTAIDHAVAVAVGSDPGPVHVNCPFREPLSPDPEPWSPHVTEGLDEWQESGESFTFMSLPSRRPEPHEAAWLGAALEADARGLVIVGGLPPGTNLAPIRALLEALGWPAIADARSGLRGGDAPPVLMSALERITSADGVGPYAPEVVLQLGSRLTSKRLLALSEGEIRDWVVVDPSTARLDPSHRASARVFAQPDGWAVSALETLEPEAKSTHAETLAPLAAKIRAAIDRAIDAEETITEPFVARYVTRETPPDHGLYISSSLPIRDVDAFGADHGPSLRVASNRGASGIDGVVASAVGFTLARAKPSTLLIGDLALLHDANSLALVSAERVPLTIVVLNNGGGGIFHFLPIARHEGLVSPWFDTPHSADFGHLAAAFSLPHVRCDDIDAFTTAYGRATATGEPLVIEVGSGTERNLEVHQRIEAEIQATWPGT